MVSVPSREDSTAWVSGNRGKSNVTLPQVFDRANEVLPLPGLGNRGDSRQRLGRWRFKRHSDGGGESHAVETFEDGAKARCYGGGGESTGTKDQHFVVAGECAVSDDALCALKVCLGFEFGRRLEGIGCQPGELRVHSDNSGVANGHDGSVGGQAVAGKENC